MTRALLAVLVLVVALPEPAWARGRGFHHHRHRSFFIGGAFFAGPPVWYAYRPGPYYYGPAYQASNAPPSVYVEKFEGTPSAEAGEIYCPQLDQHYPAVQECPGGWQRIIRAAEASAPGEYMDRQIK
jgi:uncharacterized protein YbaR (Trm112 family)